MYYDQVYEKEKTIKQTMTKFVNKFFMYVGVRFAKPRLDVSTSNYNIFYTTLLSFKHENCETNFATKFRLKPLSFFLIPVE